MSADPSDDDPDALLRDCCVACQRPIVCADQWARFGQVLLPVCVECWRKLDTATQIRLAMELQDRLPGGVRDAIRSLAEQMGRSLDSISEDNPPWWMRGQSPN